MSGGNGPPGGIPPGMPGGRPGARVWPNDAAAPTTSAAAAANKVKFLFNMVDLLVLLREHARGFERRAAGGLELLGVALDAGLHLLRARDIGAEPGHVLLAELAHAGG